jgi:hypothetical protein
MRTALAIGKAVLEHEVLPLFQEGGCGVPVKRVLKNDHLMLEEERLLAWNVDIEIRIFFVEVAKRHTREIAHGLNQDAIDSGFMKCRMGELDEHFSRRHFPEA